MLILKIDNIVYRNTKINKISPSSISNWFDTYYDFGAYFDAYFDAYYDANSPFEMNHYGVNVPTDIRDIMLKIIRYD